MTNETLKQLEQKIEEARSRGDLAEVARLRFDIPLEVRNELDAKSGHKLTSAGRGYRGTPAALHSTTSGANVSTPTVTTGFRPTILIDDSAWRQLDGDHFGPGERGGYLFGPIDEPDVITYAIVADLDEDRTRKSVVLDRDAGHDFWESMPSDMTIRGSWHCHPPDYNAQPSSIDLKAARGSAATYNRSWFELVVCDAPVSVMGKDSSRLEISATIVRADGTYVSATPLRSY